MGGVRRADIKSTRRRRKSRSGKEEGEVVAGEGQRSENKETQGGQR